MTNLDNRTELRNQLKELQHLSQSRSDQTPYEQALYQTVVVMARQVDRLSKDLYLLERKYQLLLQETQAHPLPNKQVLPSVPERNLIPPQDMDYWYQQAQSYEDLTSQELEQHRQAERVQPGQVNLTKDDLARAKRYQRWQSPSMEPEHPYNPYRIDRLVFFGVLLLILVVCVLFILSAFLPRF